MQQKDVPQNASSTAGQASSSSPLMTGDVQIPTVSADVAADIAKYTNKVDYTLPFNPWRDKSTRPAVGILLDLFAGFLQDG